MPAWIKIEGDINGKYRPLLVPDSQEATRLKEGDAQQVTRSATDSHPNYLWRSVPIGGFPAWYVVEGSEKPKKK
jgi:hypothetical protein